MGTAYTWDLKNDIHDEEQHDDNRIAVTSEFQFFIHARNSCETEIRSVDERDGVHGAENGKKTAVNSLANRLSELHQTRDDSGETYTILASSSFVQSAGVSLCKSSLVDEEQSFSSISSVGTFSSTIEVAMVI